MRPVGFVGAQRRRGVGVLRVTLRVFERRLRRRGEPRRCDGGLRFGQGLVPFVGRQRENHGHAQNLDGVSRRRQAK